MNRMEEIRRWFLEPEAGPLLIAGPCGAESRGQVLATAGALGSIPSVSAMRCGIWKPRTQPGSFEGMGSRALAWLSEARESTGLPMAVEVANHRHVEACLKAGIDILWVGARTSSSPFAVQEIASSLEGSSIPVFVKNPLVPDLKLWKGAIDRLLQAGLPFVAAVHRGFYPAEKSTFRNLPAWDIPIELKRRFPELRVLCDPSHIAGKAEFVPLIAQKAFDLRFDGLMVEVHPDPPNARSDADQQLDPATFANMLQTLRCPGEMSPNEEFNQKLAELRFEIDACDDRILHLIRDRFKLVGDIALLKMANNISPLQMKRWDEILKTRIALAKDLGLDQEFIRHFLELMHDQALDIQEDLSQNGKSLKN